jgi:glycosyltransferase involved in cell wall biosynthesis
MNILINFSPLKTGGGQNVGLNFLHALQKINDPKNNYYFIVAKNSLIHQFMSDNKCAGYYVFPNNPIRRIFYELINSKKIIKKHNINIIYTYFGFGLFPKEVLQISGAADSNILFPEINFWEGYKRFALLKRKLIDKYRVWGLKNVNGIIFENKELENRFNKLIDSKAMVTTILPSINLDYHKKEYLLSPDISGMKKGLFLCGWHLNKNILLIPQIASFLKEKRIKFHFILTAPQDGSSLHKRFLSLVSHYGVNDYITITGPVRKDELYSLYQQIDIVFLLSKLESFSNNIIEAWNYKKLLIITDKSWAKSICGEAAIYVDRNDAFRIAKQIEEILFNDSLYNKITNKGIERLKDYPAIEEKTKKEIDFIYQVYENN